MRMKKRPFHFFLLAVLLTIGIGYLMNSLPPSYVYAWRFISIPLLPLVLLLLLSAIFSFCTYLFHSYIQGILVAVFIGLYLFLRYVNLTSIFFLLLLIALFGTLELFFLKKK